MAAQAGNAVGPVRRKFAPWNDPAAKPFIEFRGVTKRFGDFVAVDDLSLVIYEREFFALLGPSGCGKTTLMRMVAGFEEPSARGLPRWPGPAGVPPYRRLSNMMFQSYALFPHMTVEQNIASARAGTACRRRRSRCALRMLAPPSSANSPSGSRSAVGRPEERVPARLAKKPKVLLPGRALRARQEAARGDPSSS
jgi:putrescine transport system ATP-binding protein